MPSREGFNIISEHFNPGELAPVQVIVKTDGKSSTVKEDLEKLTYVELVSEGRQGAKNSTAIGVLLDTFIVSPLLVPSITVLHGK